MIISHITINNFGAIRFYAAKLDSTLNVLDTDSPAELLAAIELLLCCKCDGNICINDSTSITAKVRLRENLYFVELKPNGKNSLNLTARDAGGKDKTNLYRGLVSHCLEQDNIENFDGRDKTVSVRLCRYLNLDDAPKNLSARTDRLTDMKTFRSHLIGYIKAFRPEPINCKKAYMARINPNGQFEVFNPAACGGVYLSETEEKLFRYICFLNVAEFWAEIETIRDLHHEKKPLIVRHFLEFLDESVNIDALVARTIKLQRQTIIITLPLSSSAEKKWL